MPENNFEKQVQDIFNEMKLKPSAEVWPKVRERIKKDKDRRRFLFWIPAALLLLGTGGYWLFSSPGTTEEGITKGTVTAVQQHTKETVSAVAPGADQKGETLSSTANDVQENNNQSPAADHPASETSIDNTIAAGNNEPIAKAIQPAGNKINNKNKIVTDPNGITGDKNKDASPLSTELNSRNQKDNKKLNGVKAVDDDPNIVTAAPGETGISADRSLSASFQQVTAGENVLSLHTGEPMQPTSLNKNITTAKPLVKLGKKKSWEWGVSGGAGVSALGKGLARDIFAKKALENNTQAAPAPPGLTDNYNYAGLLNGYLAAAQPPPASPVKAGLAWNAGGFAKWHVGKRFSLSGGLEYGHFTTQRQVGKALTFNPQATAQYQLDNARYSGSYANNSSADVTMYTNQYHFIQMPLGIEWQVNKGIVLPVIIDAGLSLGYMVNTNALHYKTTSGLYYQDKSLFNKMQGGLYAGLQVKLLQHSSMPLYAGPFVQYNYTSLTKNSSDSKQNFMYAGLKLQWVLLRK